MKMFQIVEPESSQQTISYLEDRIKTLETENNHLNIAINGVERLYYAATDELKQLKRAKGEELERKDVIINKLKEDIVSKNKQIALRDVVIGSHSSEKQLFIKQNIKQAKELGELRSVLRFFGAKKEVKVIEKKNKKSVDGKAEIK